MKIIGLPDTFPVALMQLSALINFTVAILLLIWFVIWPNQKLNAYKINTIFNNGIGPFHGWQCGESNPNSGYYIFIGFQLSALCLYVISAAFCILDYCLEKNGTLKDYKVFYPPPRPLQNKISWKLYKKSIFLAALNDICSMFFIPTLYIPLMEWRGICDFDFYYEDIYDLFFVLLKLAIIPYLSDFIFYTTHRTAHEIGFLYRRIHKIHHEFVESYAISATAAHPLEMLLCNLLTVIGSPLILGLPLFWFYIFVTIACIQTALGHSGYGSPFRKIRFGNAVPHDYHHHFIHCEYGSGSQGTFDKIFRTRLEDIYPKRMQQIKSEYVKKTQ